jgi:hypothetical protein
LGRLVQLNFLPTKWISAAYTPDRELALAVLARALQGVSTLSVQFVPSGQIGRAVAGNGQRMPPRHSAGIPSVGPERKC